MTESTRDAVERGTARGGAVLRGDLRIGLVEDHEAVWVALRAELDRTADLRLVVAAASVRRMLAAVPDVPELVILDLRLADGSSPVTNIARLTDAGARVVVYTSGENRFLLRAIARTPAIGIVRKSDPLHALVGALRSVARGRLSIDPDLATSIATDPRLPLARLTRHEQQILSRFADGHTAQHVADESGIALSTVEDAIRRIRAKYAAAGRAATTKVDLYKRAVEDGFLPLPTR